MKKQDKIELNKEQCDVIIARLEANTLIDSDRNIIALIIQGYFWLQSVLQESKIIKRSHSARHFFVVDALRQAITPGY